MKKKPSYPGRHAVVFGMNYAGRSGIGTLNGCLTDAHYWAGLVKEIGFDSSKVYLERTCTRTAMFTAIETTIKKARAGDLVAICYSGHGTIVPPGIQSWVPYDFNWKKPSTWLTYDELDHLLLEHEERGVLVVVITDSCYSKADPRKHFRKLSDRTRIRFLEPPPEIQCRIVASPFHRNVLTADQDDVLLAGAQRTQTSADDYIDGAFHGAFTYALSEALAAKPNVSYQQAVIKARAWLAENDYDQVPSANGSPASLQQIFFKAVSKPVRRRSPGKIATLR